MSRRSIPGPERCGLCGYGSRFDIGIIYLYQYRCGYSSGPSTSNGNIPEDQPRYVDVKVKAENATVGTDYEAIENRYTH